MNDQRLFIEIRGVGPDDIPVHDDEPIQRDEAGEITDDVHDLLREEYNLTDVKGVVTVVNPATHDRLDEEELAG